MINLKTVQKLFQKYKYLALVIGAGLVLLMWPRPDAPAAQTPEPVDGYAAFAVDEMEKRLAETLSRMEGAGRVKVMLTLKSDMEVLYLEDVDEKVHTEWENGQAAVQDRESKGKTVLAGASGGNRPVKTGRVFPVYQGALVVCEGAGNAQIQLQIKEAVSALTGLSGAVITVTPMAEEG